VEDRRLYATLAAAVCVHGALAAELARSRAPLAASPKAAPLLVERIVELEEAPLAPPTQASLPAPPRARSAVASATTPANRPDVREQNAPSPPPNAQPLASTEPWSFSPSVPVDLGIGTHWKVVAAASASVPPPPPEASVSPPSWQQLMQGELAARDQELGLGPGGALVTAAHEAASGAEAPEEGSATLEIVCDASGAVTDGRVTGATGDLPAWTEMARPLVRQMHGKTMRLPPGAKGLRARLAVRIARTLPSGDKVVAHVGALPDDMPSAGRVCEGTGWSRKCVGGMPVGATVQGADVANAAARLRTVSVRMLDAVGL
jgi:hypothetical protein